MARSILDLLKERKVLLDGGFGTELIKNGFPQGASPESWNIEKPDIVKKIHKSYYEAGSDAVLTNSFGGSPIKLAYYGLQDRASELNRKAAEISRLAAGDTCLVAGSIGPTGEMLMMGNVSEEQIFDGFLLQAQSLKEGGAEALVVETMTAVYEAVLAVKAALETGLDVACTMTFNKTADGSFMTMMKVSIEEMVSAITSAGALAPVSSRNLKPFHLAGLWLAVMIIPPPAF